MASLSDIGKIYYLSTKEVLCHHLEDFENTTKELFDTLAKTYSQKVVKPDMNDAIMKLVEQLTQKNKDIKDNIQIALQQVEKHKKISELKDELAKKDQEILLLLGQLKEAESILATALFQARKKLEVTEQARQSSVSCEELIKFAFRISSGNSVEAPPDWQPGVGDPRRPYPLDIEMRCGALGQLSIKGIVEPAPVSTTAPPLVEPLVNTPPTTTTVPAVGAVPPLNLLNDTATLMDVDKKADDPLTVHAESTTTSTTRSNGGLWQGPPVEDMAHLATMPVSAMMSHSTNNGVASSLEEPHLTTMPVAALTTHPTNHIEVGYMSTSSESSSSGESS